MLELNGKSCTYKISSTYSLPDTEPARINVWTLTLKQHTH
jgi:hypothetical protein